MLKRLLPMVLLLSLGLTLCGCSTDTSDANYTKIIGKDGFSFYVDRSAVQVDKAQAADAKKITDEVESYVLTIFYRPYNGYIGVVTGGRISDSEPPTWKPSWTPVFNTSLSPTETRIFPMPRLICAMTPSTLKTTLLKSSFPLK